MQASLHITTSARCLFLQCTDSQNITVIIVSVAVASIVAITLVHLLRRRRRRSAPKRDTGAQPRDATFRADGDDLGLGGGLRRGVRSPASSAVGADADGGYKSPLHQRAASLHTPAEADPAYGEGIIPLSTPASADRRSQSGGEHDKDTSASDRNTRLANEDAVIGPANTPFTATASIAAAPTAHGLAKLHQTGPGQVAADAAPVVGGSIPDEASTLPEDIGLGETLLTAAQELASHCPVPGVGEAARAVIIIANLVKDCRENETMNRSTLVQSHAIVSVLERAARVVEKVSFYSKLCAWLLPGSIVRVNPRKY